MLAEDYPDPRIVDATEDHDASIVALANGSGLRVDPVAHRGGSGALLLAFVDAEGNVQGFVSARILLDEMEIFDLCVAEEARRGGIGRALLLELFRRGTAAGASDVFLEVRASNEAARALYQSLGFSRIGGRPGYYADGEDAALFRCCLLRAR